MSRFIGLLIVALVLQLGARPAAGDELWTYYFTADGSRPFYQPCYGDCVFDGTRADLAGTFSILLNWQTGAGTLFSFDAQLVNVASVRGASGVEVLTPLVPSYSTASIFWPGATPQFAPSRFSYVQGSGRLKSPEVPAEIVSLETQNYDISFGLTSATLSMSIPYFYPYTTNTDVYWPTIPFLSKTITNAHATLLSARVAGEYTNDDRIDARDYVAWRKGGSGPLDFTLWRKFYGTGASVAAGAAVPEPPAAMLMPLAGALAAILGRGRRAGSRCAG